MTGTDILRRVPLFAGCDRADLDPLVDAARRVRYPAGSIVFQEGDAGDFLLALTKGRVKVTLLGDDGAEVIISFLDAPALLGEVAFFDDSPRSATVVSVETSEFLQIGRAPFLDLITRRPALALRMMAQLTRTLRRATEQVRSLAMFDLHGRMLRALLMLAQQGGQRSRSRMAIRPRPAVRDLAMLCGCTREAAGRALKVLQAAGYVTESADEFVVEARAIRKYLQPALAHIVTSGTDGSSDRPQNVRD